MPQPASDDPHARRLAAILFADIAGYTALMQSDEQRALQMLNAFEVVLEKHVPSFGGSIVQYFGDGCLLSFESSTKSVECALALQKAFVPMDVPVRMGIHLGDVVFKADNVFGDGVNIASRIESMGIPGSILVSDTIRRQVRNEPGFQLSSLGSFEFKNVDEAMEVYALTNEGLAVPDPRTVEGKFKATSPHARNFFQLIWDKKVPQILLVYFVISWILLQFTSRALARFQLAPEWSDILFVCIIGVIPSLLVYVNNRDRIRRFSLTRGEKMLFPSNLLALGAILFFMFRGTDLGAMTKTISFTNADGVVEKEKIVKEQYRTQFAIYPFEQLQDDSASAWLHLAMPMILEDELSQDKFLTPFRVLRIAGIEGTDFSMIDKINYSRRFEGDYYVDGAYQFNEGAYEISPQVHDKVSGKVIERRTFRGNDFFPLVDSVGVFIRRALGLTERQIQQSADLDYAKWISDDLNAVRLYYGQAGIGNQLVQLEHALQIDPDFAMAWYDYADILHHASLSQEESERSIAHAMRLRRKLPYQNQIAIMTLHHLIYDEWDKAEQLLKLQLEIEPSNDEYNGTLSHIYFATRQLDKLADHARKRYLENPTPAAKGQFMRMLVLAGELQEMVDIADELLEKDPENLGVLQYQGAGYGILGDYDKSREIIENIILLTPEVESTLSPALRALDYHQDHPPDPKALSMFVGTYRRSDREALTENYIVNNHLLSQSEKLLSVPLWQISGQVFVVASIVAAYEDEFELNDNGEVYRMKIIQTAGRRIAPPFYKWKQDSLIWQAEALLRTGEYRAAGDAYSIAIEKHPEHHYLHQAKEHVNYVITTDERTRQRNYQNLTGRYGKVNLLTEGGHLFVKIPGNPRFRLRPISPSQFITLSNYDQLFEIVTQDGQVIGINQYQFDNARYEWPAAPAAYLPRSI